MSEEMHDINIEDTNKQAEPEKEKPVKEVTEAKRWLIFLFFPLGFIFQEILFHVYITVLM